MVMVIFFGDHVHTWMNIEGNIVHRLGKALEVGATRKLVRNWVLHFSPVVNYLFVYLFIYLFVSKSYASSIPLWKQNKQCCIGSSNSSSCSGRVGGGGSSSNSSDDNDDDDDADDDEDSNSPILDHVYLFNYLMLMIFPYLFIAFNHVDEKKFSFGSSLCNSGFCYRKISEKLIVGLDNYSLKNYYYYYFFYITSQRSKFRATKIQLHTVQFSFRAQNV